jgi:hypothetical protein
MTRSRLRASPAGTLATPLAKLAAGFAATLIVAFVAALISPVTAFAASADRALTAVSGDVDDFTFDSFDADYTLTRADDGTSRLEVVETIVAVFPRATRTAASAASSPTRTITSRSTRGCSRSPTRTVCRARARRRMSTESRSSRAPTRTCTDARRM